MFELSNDHLTVELLDPALDPDRFGPRFCSGGFIWQVRDANGAPLLTGPEWPDPHPLPFNGQGLPESFRHRTLGGLPLTWRGIHGIAIGAGELALESDGTTSLVDRCGWTITRSSDRATFVTEHVALGFAYRLERTVALEANQLHSITRLTNLATEPLVTEWFAHPFFALPSDGLAVAEFPEGFALPENPGFGLIAGALRQKRRFAGKDDGHFDRLRLPPGTPLTARVAHPTLGAITFNARFAPSQCIVWGNDRTFSIEPYLSLNLAPRHAETWRLEYQFGA